MDSSLMRHYKKSALAGVFQSHQELHQTTIMKFVALALALLVAVGSQAASLQADAPSQLEQIRSAVDVYLIQVRDSAKKALDQLDGTEYSELKSTLSQRMDTWYNQLKAMQTAVSPVTDSVVTTIADATAELRTSITKDIDALKIDLEPKRVALRGVLTKHIEEYRKLLEPTITDYANHHRQEMEALKTKLEPVLEDLRQKIEVNVEETKSAIMPIVESVRAKIYERLEEVKSMVKPYVDEYVEQIKAGVNQAQSINADDLTALREKIAPLVDDVKTKLQEIFETIAATVTKN
ncbi:LOW QUALITY PROTEIN: apolipoprotein A-I-like [Plectropomus leopardus]|uniref:LOW QUALITY PROTEIN: apolipoprotein A-I-like n=1 Tax=Plectropomus leopardus TaxID=160734 RepID=UPI001C4CF440|nr:LOW QUALITY PROTEIN: apolipoprotein A-I-like [Plectropomus leopardus]